MRRPAGITALVVLVAALLGLQLLLRGFFTALLLPTREAQWIWLPDAGEESGPVAFYAARDFELTDAPTSAHLRVAAVDEALVFVNAVPIGGTRYANGESLRVYDVGQAVRQGTNRMVVEVRGVRGVGGLLLRLHVETRGSGPQEVVTNSSWSLFREPDDALFDAELSLERGLRPRVWGPAPTGRWQLSRRPEPAPTIAELKTTDKAAGAQRFRLPASSRRWLTLAKTDRSSPALGNWVIFDFGRDLMAYLALRFPAQVEGESRPLGLLYLGRQPGISNRSRADAYVVAMPGQRVWLDAKPRRFRYATFVGLMPVSGADAYPVNPEHADRAWPREVRLEGPFGLPVSDLGPSLEDEVWSELHRLPSVTGRE